VRVRTIDNLATIVDGANELAGIEFVVSERSKLLD
jgi:uncharacterized protein YggE